MLLAPARVTTPTAALLPAVTPDGSLCGDLAAAEGFAAELAKRFPQSTLHREVSIPVVRAAIALKRDQPQQAIDLLRVTGIGGGTGFVPYYLRGQAYLRLERPTDAATEFRTILGHRGWAMTSVIYPLARVGLARALAMSGDATASRGAYEAFFAAWKDADPGLPVMVETRNEHARLTKPSA